jgi:hypothetical protein
MGGGADGKLHSWVFNGNTTLLPSSMVSWATAVIDTINTNPAKVIPFIISPAI